MWEHHPAETRQGRRGLITPPTWPCAGLGPVALDAGKQYVVVIISVKPGLVRVVDVHTFTHGCGEGHLQLPWGCVGDTGTCAVAMMDVKVQDGHALDASVPAVQHNHVANTHTHTHTGAVRQKETVAVSTPHGTMWYLCAGKVLACQHYPS